MTIEYDALPLVEDPVTTSTVLAVGGDGTKGRMKLSDLIGRGVGVNKVTITGHGQFIEADNGFARITSDWYTVLSAPSAPCVRYIYGDTGFHLVPIDYGGAGLVKINGVADIAVFDMPGLYVLECVSEIAWKVSPAADYDAIDTAIATAVSGKLDAGTFNARNLTAGNGLTGGGQLSADRSFAVGANGDGSIVVNADDIQVGILATDAQHGERGGGTQHAAATTSVAGFLSATDKTALDKLKLGLAPTGRRSVSGNVTVDADDNILLLTASSDVTLPAAADGRIVTLKKATATAITVNIVRAGSEKIENVAATYAATSFNSALYVAMSLYCDGTDWWIL